MAALTLAGAAEEVLGKAVAAQGNSHALAEHVQLVLDLNKIFHFSDQSASEIRHRSNFSRNLVKHSEHGKIEPAFLDFEEEARDMLERAIHNYAALVGNTTSEMERIRDVTRNAL